MRFKTLITASIFLLVSVLGYLGSASAANSVNIFIKTSSNPLDGGHQHTFQPDGGSTTIPTVNCVNGSTTYKLSKLTTVNLAHNGTGKGLTLALGVYHDGAAFTPDEMRITQGATGSCSVGPTSYSWYRTVLAIGTLPAKVWVPASSIDGQSRDIRPGTKFVQIEPTASGSPSILCIPGDPTAKTSRAMASNKGGGNRTLMLNLQLPSNIAPNLAQGSAFRVIAACKTGCTQCTTSDGVVYRRIDVAYSTWKH